MSSAFIPLSRRADKWHSRAPELYPVWSIDGITQWKRLLYIYIYMYTVRRDETIPWMVALIGWRMATKKNLLLEEPPTRPTIDAAASSFFFFLFFFIISLSLFFFLFFLFFRLLFTRTIIVRRSMNSQPRKLARTFLFLRTNWERTRLILHCWASRA